MCSRKGRETSVTGAEGERERVGGDDVSEVMGRTLWSIVNALAFTLSEVRVMGEFSRGRTGPTYVVKISLAALWRMHYRGPKAQARSPERWLRPRW